MSTIGKTTFVFLFRIIPIGLIFALSIFWSNEKNMRIQAERTMDQHMNQLLDAENRVQTLQTDLDSIQTDLKTAQQQALQAQDDRNYLITQLGERDEHIRGLLAEMIQVLSGSGKVDLGQINVNKDASAWKGVQRELEKITQAPPIAATPQATFRQVAVEEVKTPVVQRSNFIAANRAQQPVQTSPKIEPKTQAASPSKIEETISVKPDSDRISGEILVVNDEHQFIVFNRGQKDGVHEGMNLWVSQAGKVLGELKVETVYEKISAAAVLSGHIPDFKKGDKVQNYR